ncbi:MULTISPECIES: bifunctional precorrin-2 dehydrogenase/sirohydrochlorin ferrochelatase [unclassified Bacillus (in: firmicutes)]|uniref:precorrin-2 dehydrogenase/sirohydrochlorin ferrochelatase family protein n=1 Tax=unclassified Bacillus (in: firmicutes) TaxID=185979 RepID=UPI000BF10BED|nr:MULTISPECIES: NAD(P)-dependent oxidoreductase [unclassified Bacillus (in: firmicutes)]PEJ58594.1 precorrin-2 dehydrogenase [Bacillus sp. AFS002410]PEL09378.1 precorrin-2 dehydrogenase [Bacillus sp. AFS017336]
MTEMVPLLFTLENKRVTIIGGGQIAFRKAKAFLKSGATITIISPQICEELRNLPTIKLMNKYFEKDDIKDAHIVIAATNDKNTNKFIKDCMTDFQWFNDVSDQSNSDFHTPAVVRRGDLVVSVSTSGKSPVLSKKIKKELENYFEDHYSEIVNEYAIERKKPAIE